MNAAAAIACLLAAVRALRLTLPAATALATCMAVALGLGLWSSLSAAALFLGAPGWAEAAAAFVLLGGALFLRPSPDGAAARPADPVGGRLRLLLVATTGLCVAFAVEHALRFRDGGWDAWMIWNSRARFLSSAGTHWRDAFSPEIGGAEFGVHGDYPLLLPMLVAETFAISGQQSPVIPAALALVFGGLAASIPALLVRALRGPTWGAACALALTSTPALPTLAASQYADLPLATFFCSAVACASFGAPGNVRPWIVTGLFLSLCAWTKNEGLLPLIAVPAALALHRRARGRELLLMAIGALPVVALLAAFKICIAPPGDMMPDSWRAFVDRATDASRWGAILLGSARRFVYFQLWGLHLVAAAVAMVWLLGRRARWASAEARVALASAAMVLAGLFSAYLVSPHDLAWHLRTSLDRLFIQVWPVALAGIFLAFPPPGEVTAIRARI